MRVPGAWDGFELAVRAILGQQISVGAATRLAGRLVERFGTALPAHLRSGDHDVRSVFPSPALLTATRAANPRDAAQLAATAIDSGAAAALLASLVEQTNRL